LGNSISLCNAGIIEQYNKMGDVMILGYIDPGTGYTIVTSGGWLAAFLLGFLGGFFFFIKKIFRFLKNHFRIILIVILLGTIIWIIMQQNKNEFNDKVIVLGFDGLSPNILEPLMEKGKLPNFSRLKEQGAYQHLSTTNPPQSPVAWTGFATGQNPGKTGIYDFIARDPKTYNVSLSFSNIKNGKASRVIKSKRFWQYTSERKVPTIIIKAPLSFPPDKIYGRMLSGMGVPDILGTEGTFSFYTTEDLTRNNAVGGKVFKIRKSTPTYLNLIGPKIASLAGRIDNAKIPAKITLLNNMQGISIEFQNQSIQLNAGQWSDWAAVTFKAGFFKKIKGVFKFFLVESSPEIKLYASPINFDPRNPLLQLSFPKKYSKELADNIGLYHTQGIPFDTWAVNENRLPEDALLEQINSVQNETEEMLHFELNRFKKGVLFCYFESPDIIQHMFWRYRDTQHPLYDENASHAYKGMIEKWYKKMDDALGDVMSRLNKDDLLIVLSDHGFDTFRRSVHINAWLRKNGYLELKNPQAESGGELLRDIDFSKTKAYSVGFGSIYINQRNREREGIVNPGKETEDLKKRLLHDLLKWHDKKDDKALINNVYLKNDIFWGDSAHNAPDIYIGFNIGYRASWQTALGGVPEELIEDNLKKWSGSHLFDPVLVPGIIFSNTKFTKQNPSIYDIAPTILKITGYDDEMLKKCDFDGESLF